jgi:7-carboxy-7-deazaguanine synthase
MKPHLPPPIELPIMESFYTLQGEGFHQGKAAYFIRLAGCNVGCSWCDVKESWAVEQHPCITVNDLVDAVKKQTSPHQRPLVVITGGEPLMYDLIPLTTHLQHQGYQTHLETSGTYPLSGQWNWVCLSPKKFKAPLPANLAIANELKIIVFNRSDFLFAEQQARHVANTCKLYLQPEWSKAEQVTPLIIQYIKENPQWELSLQIHKYINVP